MGDLATALARGWDGDDEVVRAILFLRSLKDSYSGSSIERLVTRDQPLDYDEVRALCLLVFDGYVTVEPDFGDDPLGLSDKIVTATETGIEARIRLSSIWRKHYSSNRLFLKETRAIYRNILLEGIYHMRPRSLCVKIHQGCDIPCIELPDEPWLQLAGVRLGPEDVAPELEYLVEAKLLATKRLSPRWPHADSLRDYNLTREGVDHVERLGGAMSATPSQQEENSHQEAESKSVSRPSSVTVNNFHAAVSNVHSGSGDINVGIDPSTLGRFVAQLNAFMPSLTFPDESGRSELNMTVEALRVETNKGRAAKLTHRIRELVSKAQGPLKEIAIGVIDAELGKLTGTQ